MKKEFNVIIEEGEDGYYISEVIELPGCRTQAKTVNELMARTKEAIELYLETEGDLSSGGNLVERFGHKRIHDVLSYIYGRYMELEEDSRVSSMS